MKQFLASKAGKAILVVITLLLFTSTVIAGGGGPYISRYVIGGGGGHSQAGHYVMDATIGQAVVGMFSTAPYELCAGFWCSMSEYKVYLPMIVRN
jgi:hypothetical protein